MKKNKNIIILLLAALLGGTAAKAQTDPHFSQYYAYPMWLNPGLTGAIDGDYRVTGIYRNQWGNINSGFSTPGVSADMVTSKNINLGVNLLNQTAAGGAYNYLNGYVSVAYTGLRFGRDGNHRVSIGLSGGIINRKFNPSKFQSGSQWDDITNSLNLSIPMDDILSKNSALTFDAGAGIMYFDATPGKRVNLFGGFSAFHLTQPDDPFISGKEGNGLPIRYTVHGGAKIGINDVLSLTPNLLYMRQAKSEEKMASLYGQLRVSESTDFLLGANYRLEDAISPYIGVYHNNLVLGLSYDVNTSDLSKIAGNANSFELSLTFTGRKRSKTEPVPFVCPRL
jgi:type IX secretion system PorP/SprF family membrane protein